MAQDTAGATVTKRVEYLHFSEDGNRVMIRVDHGEQGGQVAVPYLTGRRFEQDETTGVGSNDLSLTLDGRFGLTLPGHLTDEMQDEIVEFIANAIAVGAGYPSIYYTDRKMPFRG